MAIVFFKFIFYLINNNFYKYFLGSVIFHSILLAATVAGLARKINESLCHILHLKFLLLELKILDLEDATHKCFQKQGQQLGASIIAQESKKIFINHASKAFLYI